MADSLALNFTVICMVKEPVVREGEFAKPNTTALEPMYSLTEEAWLFSAIAIGNIIGTLPLTWANNVLGVRTTFFIYGMASGLSTLFTPFFVSIGFAPTFLMRVIQGFGLSISMTSLGAIVSSWSSLQESGIYISILSLHLQLGAILVMPISGELCQSSMGWPAVYYILGALTILSFILFFAFYENNPEDHFLVSEMELSKIKKGRMAQSGEHFLIPYKDIITDIPVIGIIVCCFGGCFALQIMFQYGPIYLNKVLKLDITKTGFAGAFPFVLSVIVKLVAGPISDLVTCVSQKTRIIVFNTVSQLPIGICFILMAYAPPGMGLLVGVSYSLVNSFDGLNAVGVAKCVQLISQHHAHFIMTIMSLTNSLVILILPFIVSSLAPDNTESQWAIVWYLLAVIVFMTMVFFNVVCEAEPRPWTKIKKESTEPSLDITADRKLNDV
ncbi:hypothetical protein FO519_000823 [Halicephalobus sp. NKZ332]|nr:hypothetical protein FO519_000823 [Halicephalobus sp. NKZ332]